MRKGADQRGMELDCGANAKAYMLDAGLVDVKVSGYIAPYGAWMAKVRPETLSIGEHEGRVAHMLPGITRDLDLSNVELCELQEECLKTLAVEDAKCCIFYVTMGRKT